MSPSLSIMTRSLIAALAAAAPVQFVQAATVTASVNANVVKPLTFTSKQDLDFGTILLPALAVPLTVTVAPTGARLCPAPLTCTGTARQAIFNVTGSNGMVVRLVALPSDLINSSDGSKIRFTPVSQPTVTLTNSGNPGSDVSVGGSIVVPANATAGLYVGEIEITADYP